jgi:hypothetical protein
MDSVVSTEGYAMTLRDLVRTMVVLSVCLGCVSCAIRNEYPPDWPSLAQLKSDCSKIAGAYKERGTGLEGLSDKFFGDRGNPRDYVEITYSPDSVEVISFGGSQPSWVKRFTRQDGNFVCANGRVELSFSRGCRVCPGATYESLKVSLMRADDGSLIAQTEGVGAYLAFFIIPAASTLNTWDRYFPR